MLQEPNLAGADSEKTSEAPQGQYVLHRNGRAGAGIVREAACVIRLPSSRSWS
jgi:hypothetical protein